MALCLRVANGTASAGEPVGATTATTTSKRKSSNAASTGVRKASGTATTSTSASSTTTTTPPPTTTTTTTTTTSASGDTLRCVAASDRFGAQFTQLLAFAHERAVDSRSGNDEARAPRAAAASVGGGGAGGGAVPVTAAKRGFNLRRFFFKRPSTTGATSSTASTTSTSTTASADDATSTPATTTTTLDDDAALDTLRFATQSPTGTLVPVAGASDAVQLAYCFSAPMLRAACASGPQPPARLALFVYLLSGAPAPRASECCVVLCDRMMTVC